MPWQDNSGNGGGRGPVRGPWGQPPKNNNGGGDRGGRGGNEPPDLEELLQASRQRLKRAFPRGGRRGSGGGDGGGLGPKLTGGMGALIGLGLLGLWLFSGVYQVGPSELGVVTTFGKYSGVNGPGLHWHAPAPIQNARMEQVTTVRSNTIPAVAAQRGQQSEGLMLTGDKNIVDIGMTVQWKIKADAAGAEGQLPPVAQFMFLIDVPENLVVTIGESAIREVVGRNELDFVQTEGRTAVQQETRALMQEALDMQNAGIEIVSVNLTKTEPPTAEVNEAFLDVIAAGQDREQYINRARQYANKVVPEARGQAQRILEDARGYSARVTAEARGQANRFSAILGEYEKAPEVTRQRMYLETVERVLGDMNKIIIEDEAGSGVVPYLPLTELQRRSNQGSTQQ